MPPFTEYSSEQDQQLKIHPFHQSKTGPAAYAPLNSIFIVPCTTAIRPSVPPLRG